MTAADKPPAMYRKATLAIVVSSTSMNVGITTAAATNQGLTAGRLSAGGERATLLILRTPWSLTPCPSPLRARETGEGARNERRSALGRGGALRKRSMRLQDLACMRPRGRFLVVDE